MKENCLWYWQKKRQGKCRKDSPELKDALLRRMLPPNNESITKISREEGISEQTLRNWRDKARKEGYAAPGTDAVPDDWSTQDKFLVVVETAGMNETELAEYARKKGLYIEQIKAWKDACMNANGGIAKEASRLNRELKDSEKERRKLEKELQRKGYVCFHQSGLDRIAQTVLGSLVDHVERFHALHVGQQLSIGAGSGKVHGKIGLALARIALQNTELSKGQIRLPEPFHRGQLHVAHADDLHRFRF